MSNENSLNHFSLISRLFGNLFYRSPQDATLQNVFAWLQQKPLNGLWPLETDKQSEQALEALQMKIDLALLDQEYQRLFAGEKALVPMNIEDYDLKSEDFIAFREERGMPELEQSAVNFPLFFSPHLGLKISLIPLKRNKLYLWNFYCLAPQNS